MNTLFRNLTTLDAEAILEGGEPTEIIEEGAGEELEITDVGDELESEQGDIEQYADGANNAAADIEDLEGLETELEESLETQPDGTEGAGVNETTLASHRTTLSVLRRYNGVDTSYQAGRITKQSYEMQGVTSQDATRIVLAGIKETIVAIWERIKAALKLLWDKVVKFWDKHLSAVGRINKALNSTKAKVKGLKGNPDYTKEHKAPGAFARAFPTESTIDAAAINKYLTAHTSAIGEAKSLHTDARKTATEAASALQSAKAPSFSGKDYKIASEDKPLVTGYYATIKFVEADNSTDENKRFKGDFEKQSVESSKESVDMTIASKSQLEGLIDGAIRLIKDTTEMGKTIKDGNKAYQDDVKRITNAIGTKDQSSEDEARLRAIAQAAGKNFQFYNTVAPQVTSKVGSLNVQLAKYIVNYAKSCMAKYKKA